MGYKKNETTGKWEAWYVKRHPETGKPVVMRRTGLKSENEARKVERHLVTVVDEKIHRKIIPTWLAAVDAYMSSCRKRGLTEKTIYSMEHCLKACTIEKWGDKTVDSITTDDVQEVLLVDNGAYSNHHKKTLYNFIKNAFNFSLESNWLNRNPVPKLSFRCTTKIKKALTEEQVRFFLQKARELEWEWYPHCIVALYTGMRNGELFALRWDKVNLALRQILVDESWNNKDGFKCTKSGDDRIVEIAPSLVVILEELKLRTYNSGFVLPRIPRWIKGEQARELRMFLLGIGLPTVRFHDLRATWATLMLSRGIEPIKVMIMGGWKEMKTMQIYMRKAGVDIRGITDGLKLHEPLSKSAQILDFRVSK